jgi:histidinol-phosphate aminotransferase
MSDVLRLARPDLRDLVAYEPAAYEPALVRMNANEAPWRAPGDISDRGFNIYPPPRPAQLTAALAAHYRVPEDNLLVTRGSSEAIDVMIRAFCRAGRDELVLCPPTFGMYSFYAQVQGAVIRNVPLRAEAGYALDVDGILRAWNENSRLLFICSPNNPTGQKFDRGAISELCETLDGRAVIVIDEAYREFSDTPDYSALGERFEHVVLLRTLSKALALAGLRCGSILAAPQVISLLAKVCPPYSFPTPAIELAMQSLQPEALRIAEERLALITSERERLAEALSALGDILQVWPSEANFLLARARDADALCQRAKEGGILLRNFSRQPSTAGCVRISVGQPENNDRLLTILGGAARDATGDD